MEVTLKLLLQAYAMGVFPMSEGRDDPDLFWVDPTHRGIFDLDEFHISRSLKRKITKSDHSVTVNKAFVEVLDSCGARPQTWINDKLRSLYLELREKGGAHSLEVWSQGRLAGAVFGIQIGGVFFGESMVSPQRDGSKIALAYLVHRLKAGGFKVFDTQFITPHLQSLGAKEITRAAYHDLLDQALDIPASFEPSGYGVTAQDLIQESGHRS